MTAEGHGLGKRKALLLTATSVFLTLLLLEAGARVFQYSRNRTFEDSQLGYFYRDYFFVGPSFRPGAGGAWQGVPDMAINSMGFRGDEFPIRKAQHTLRIVTFGGSTSHAGNYPAKLQRLLQQRNTPERTYEVINAAVPTWNTTQSLIQFITRAVYLDPDLVIVYHAINDWDQPDHKWLLNLPAVDYSKHSGFLDNHSLFYHFMKDRWQRLAENIGAARFRRRFGEGDADPGDTPTHSEPQTGGSLIFKTNIESFIAVAEAKSIRVVLVTMPLNQDAAASRSENRRRAGYFYADFERIVPRVAHYNEILRELGKRQGVWVLDVAGTGFGTNAEFFVDLCHFSEAGAEAFAESVNTGLTDVLPTSASEAEATTRKSQ